MNIGETIKKLRKQKDMTQEQLAEYLNISTQAVSKWETNLTLPDITLVPMLANIFDISADVLLGIDITLKKERIEKIEKEALNYLFKSQYEEAKKILRGALKEYPNSYRLMVNLALTLRNIAWNTKAETDKKALNEEIISLCERILAECTDDKVRNVAIQYLCYTYCDIGENEKAMDLVNKLPGNGVNSDYLLGVILKGTEKFRHKQKQIVNDMGAVLREIMYLNYNCTLTDGEIAAYNPDEVAALQSKVIDIINILCEDGNFGSFSDQLSHAHLHLCDFNIQKKDYDAALQHFKLGAQHTILYDAICRRDDDTEEEYTSLIFRGMKVGNLKYISPHSNSWFLLQRIESGNYYLYFPSEEVRAIKKELLKYVNPADIYLIYQ
ncbi:MAG: helix-turn-helix domain-containing protein [Oscillospiraceae bacterium]|nr:helix-turn-helix domain-containing protein [Oscillospiraceae bacterium]